MRRGKIWWARLPETEGAGPGYSRPVIIVQANAFTESRIRTVVVVIVTKNLRLADAPGNVFLPGKKTGLPADSVANVSQIYTVDKSYLTEKIAPLPPALIRQIEIGLKSVLSL